MIRLLGLAVLLLAAQDDTPCDLAKTELRLYCLECKIWPSSDRIDKGICARCRTRVAQIETCLKYCWDCPSAHGSPKRHSKDCGAAPGCCKERPSLALVWRECDTCHARALKEADIRHKKDDCPAGSRKVCGLSGRYPHGGREE